MSDKKKMKKKAASRSLMSILFKRAGRVKDKGVKSGKKSLSDKINFKRKK